MPTTLVALVGSNPLPVYIVARELRLPMIKLVHSKQTEQPMCYLKAELKNIDGYAPTIEPVLLEDSHSPGAIKKTLTPLFSDVTNVCLAYTGGTKVMARWAQRAFVDAEGCSDQCVYCDDASQQLRYDNGREEPIAVDLTVEDILRIHGVNVISQEVVASAPVPPTADTEYHALRDLISTTARALEYFKLNAQSDLTCAREDVTFKIDFAFTRNNRLYLVKCSKERRRGDAKYDGHEVAARAAQLGGDLARSCLVCLVEGPPDGRENLDILQDDMEGIWSKTTTPAVFGAQHVEMWNEGKFDDISRWLESD